MPSSPACPHSSSHTRYTFKKRNDEHGVVKQMTAVSAEKSIGQTQAAVWPPSAVVHTYSQHVTATPSSSMLDEHILKAALLRLGC
jgi:hypothetical protein